MTALGRVDTDDRDVEEPLLADDAHWTPKADRTRAQRVKRVAFISVGIVGVVVLALAIVRSQMHRIATNAIASTAMAIERMELTAPLRDRLTLAVDMVIDSPSLFSAHTAPCNMTIVYHGASVGTFGAPSMVVSHGRNSQLFQNASLRIDNHTAWDRFARDLMLSSQVSYEIHGELAISVTLLGGLVHLTASGVVLNKTMVSTGMDGLKRMEIVDLAMNDSTETQVVARIKTCLFNPSDVRIEPVGRICMEAHYPSPGAHSHVGHLVSKGSASIVATRHDPSHPFCAARSSPSVDMRHGYNLLELQGNMLGTNEAAISGLISKYLSNTPAEMTVLACSSQASSVEIYSDAMMGLKIPAVLPPRSDALVGRMFFRSIMLDPPPQGHENDYITLTTNVSVETSSPLGPHSSLQLKVANMAVGMYAVSPSVDRAGTLIGNLTTRNVSIIDGRLIEVSNVTVSCDAQVDLIDRGKPFGRFVRDAVNQPQVHLRLAGTMNVVAQGALGELTLSNLPLDVVSPLEGMNNFQQVVINSFSLPGEPEVPAGEVLKTEISLWNPSLFSVSIGTVHLAMSLAESGDDLGRLSGLMNLHGGKNLLHLNGQINPKRDQHGVVSPGVASFFSKYLRGEGSPVQVVVKAVEFPSCTWLTDSLLGLKITTSFPGVHAGFQLISGLDMRQLDVEMTLADQSEASSNTLMRVRTDLTATLKMPASIKIPLTIPNVSVALTLQDGQDRGIGTLASDREVCEYRQQQSGFFHLNMAHYYPVQFNSKATAMNMAAFVTDLLTKQGNITMQITAERAASSHQGAFPDVITRMGMLPLAGIPISGSPQFPAMNSFQDPPVQILKIDIVKGTSASLEIAMTFAITNPSVVKTALGRLALDVSSPLARMGEAIINNFVLECCGKTSILHGIFMFHPTAADAVAASRFLSNFVCGYFTNGTDQEIHISGSDHSTPFDVLQPALSVLRIPARLPTLAKLFPDTPTLVTSSMLYTPSILHLTKIPTSLMLRNPFSESITITSANLLLYPCEIQRPVNGSLVCDSYYTVPLARFAPASFRPILIPADAKGCFACCQGAHCNTKLPMCPDASIGQCMAAEVEGFISAEAIAALFHTATTGLLMKVNGTIHASIGSYASDLFYRQEGLLVTMAK